MSDKSITRSMQMFYEEYQFPGRRPIDRDGLIFMRRFSDSMSKLPQLKRKEGMRVFDAGCGTGNTSVSLAKRFSDALFFGADNSRASLEKAKTLAEKNGITNVKFRRWNIMKPLPYKFRFDIIICLGVLHHTANMEVALLNLYKSLEDNGELYLWIYGKHGRYRHALNMQLLEMLLNTEPRPADKIKLAKEFVFNKGNFAPLDDLLGEKNKPHREILNDPVWIADQFLNPNEKLIDIKTLAELAYKSGFNIEHVIDMDGNIPDYFSSGQLNKRYCRLDRIQKLIASDLILKPERYFVILKKSLTKRRKK
ncbi:MAG: class I SAM-dependent methyltransferase [Ignavibacteria bacterium]|nr:class I SAM-dependent methyltransferase [Ignavibacteria bacterium]